MRSGQREEETAGSEGFISEKDPPEKNSTCRGTSSEETVFRVKVETQDWFGCLFQEGHTFELATRRPQSDATISSCSGQGLWTESPD